MADPVAIVLAAGASRRYGIENKLLADWEGAPMVSWPIRAAHGAGLSVTVVTGHEREVVEAALAGTMAEGDRFAFNVLHKDGMGTGIAAGVTATFDARGWLILLGDAPRVTSETLRKLLELGAPDAIIACRRGDGFSSPVLFGREFRSELIQVGGDSGGREILNAHRDRLVLVDVELKEVEDVDTPLSR